MRGYFFPNLLTFAVINFVCTDEELKQIRKLCRSFQGVQGLFVLKKKKILSLAYENIFKPRRQNYCR